METKTQTKTFVTTTTNFGTKVLMPEEVDTLAERYLSLKKREDQLKVEREELNELVRAACVDGKLSTTSGTFTVQNRKSLSWSLSAVKAVIGKNWSEYITVDNKMVKARMEQKDTVGCLLETQATVTTTEALTFTKSK